MGSLRLAQARVHALADPHLRGLARSLAPVVEQFQRALPKRVESVAVKAATLHPHVGVAVALARVARPTARDGVVPCEAGTGRYWHDVVQRESATSAAFKRQRTVGARRTEHAD